MSFCKSLILLVLSDCAIVRLSDSLSVLNEKNLSSNKIYCINDFVSSCCHCNFSLFIIFIFQLFFFLKVLHGNTSLFVCNPIMEFYNLSVFFSCAHYVLSRPCTLYVILD